MQTFTSQPPPKPRKPYHARLLHRFGWTTFLVLIFASCENRFESLPDRNIACVLLAAAIVALMSTNP